MGSCVNAPMIAVADYTNGTSSFSYNYYEDLTPADAVKILETLKEGKQPKVHYYLGSVESQCIVHSAMLSAPFIVGAPLAKLTCWRDEHLAKG